MARKLKITVEGELGVGKTVCIEVMRRGFEALGANVVTDCGPYYREHPKQKLALENLILDHLDYEDFEIEIVEKGASHEP